MTVGTYFLHHVDEVSILVTIDLTAVSYLRDSAMMLLVTLLETGYVKIHRFAWLIYVFVYVSIGGPFFIYFLELDLLREGFVSLWLDHRQWMILFHTIC